MPKLTTEEIEKRAERIRLVVDGWNGGLTGGALAGLHGITRNAVSGIVHRAKAAGQKVRVLEVKPRTTVVSKVTRRPGRPAKNGANLMVAITVPPIGLEAGQGVNRETRRKVATVRNLPAPVIALPITVDPSTLWVGFMDLQNNAGCRYSLDAKLFCNAPGFPYCPEHKAIVNPPSAQRYYGGRSAGNAQKFT